MTSVESSAASPASHSNPSSQPGSAGSPAVVGSTSAAAAAAPPQQQQRSYAHATRHSVSSPLVVGAPQHGRQESVNGTRNSANMAAPPVVNSGSHPAGPSAPVHEHSRKPSVTISASGASGQMPNGVPAAPAPRPNISFGSMNRSGSPAIASSTPNQQPAVSALQNNPRISSPAASPSPIPQPAASGGRPPDRPQAQGNNMTFGSMPGAEGAANNPMPSPAPVMPGQNAHFRRASSQSQHGDMQGAGMPMSPGYGRGGHMNGPPRGRGYNSGYPPSGQYSPGPGGYRSMQTTPRNGPGFPPHIQNQMQPGSPLGAPRSPQLNNPSMNHMQMQQGQNVYPSYPGYASQLPAQPGHFGSQPEFQPQYNYYSQQYQMHPQYMQAPPQTPRTPQFNKPPMSHQPYAQSPYAQPPSQNMSRTSSQMSERPASSVSSQHPQPSTTPSNNQVSHGHSQSTSAASQNSNFKIPSRVSKGVIIKNSDGEVLNFEKNDKKPSPAPPAGQSPSPAPPVSATPPPQAPSASTHKPTKSVAEIRQEFLDNVKKEQKREQSPSKEETQSAETGSQPKDETPPSAPSATSKPESEKAVEAAATPQSNSEQSASPAPKEVEASQGVASDKVQDENQETEEARKKREEDEEFERMVAEMEAQQAEEDAKEKAFQEKRKKEKEEAAAKEKEEASHADERMKQAEREAEAREEARASQKPGDEATEQAENQRLFASLKKGSLGSGGESTANADSEPSTPAASEVSAERESMPPPSARGGKSVGITRQKPAALKLETLKSVEPAQPTPGMRSLRSARMLQLKSESITYPEGIQSPNPALNQSGKRGGRLYDTSFLMQFQEAFKEKPSLDWDQKVKETLGDPSEPPKSARGSAPGATPRSARVPQQAFPTQPQMGGFTHMGRSNRPMGPGGPGQMAFDSGKGMNPVGGRFPGPFPGQQSNRAPSSGFNQVGSGRGPSNRGGSKTGSKISAKQQEQMNSKMPLTAGADLKPLELSGSGWKPMSLTKTGPAASTEGSGHLAPDMVQRKVKSNLNKMTPERFEKIAGQIMQIAAQSKDESDGRTLRQVIALTFEKACDEAHWASMYAQFCQRMLQEMSPEIKDENVRDKAGSPVLGGALFRKYLLNRCQEEFERGWVINLPENPEGTNEEAAMLSDEYYKAAAAKRKGLGLVQFIGELYKLRMLSIKIMHQCVTKLLDFEGEPDEASIESLCKLIRTVGGPMEAEQGGPPLIKAYFERIEKVVTEKKLPSRLYFMLMDVIDLRKHAWRSKDAQKGPKTIQEIHEEALAAQQKADAERARQNQRGGRLPSGRQDSRNFQNPPPPQDYARNTLGSDDLRKLNQRKESREARLGPSKSLGPSSMLASRSSSGRQGFGPPTGLLSRSESQAGSSPSGTHSRSVSKADIKKEEEPKTNVNAFSALAGMEGDGTDKTPASSPPLTKSQPANDGKRPE